MPYVTTAERIGMEKGLEQGLQRGLRRGLLLGALDTRREDIIRMLRMRFDPAGPLTAAAERLTMIEDAGRLQDLLMEAARLPSLEAFLGHLGVMREAR